MVAPAVVNESDPIKARLALAPLFDCVAGVNGRREVAVAWGYEKAIE